MPTPSHPAAHRIRQALVALLTLAFFAAGIGYLLVRHVLWPQAPRLLTQATTVASQALGRPVTIGRADTRWEGLHPALTLHDVTLGGEGDGDALRLPRVEAVLSWRSLLLRAPRFAALRIAGARFEAVREADGHWRVAGWRIAPDAADDRAGLRWLLAQRRVELTDARIGLADAASAEPLVLDGVDGAIRSIGRSHRFVLRIARLTRPSPGGDAAPSGEAIELQGDFAHPLHVPAARIEQWRGTAYASVGRLDLAAVAPWARALAPPGAARPDWPDGGVVAARAWIDSAGGRVVDATLKVGASDLSMRLPSGALRLSRLRADLRALREDDGHALQVRDLELVEAGGARLSGSGGPPALQLRLDASGRPRALSARVDELDLGVWLALARRLPLPQAARARLDGLDAAGRLQALAIEWRAAARADTRAQYALDARFERLSLAARSPAPGASLGAPGVPGFSGLAGRVAATASGGRLTLDAQRAALVFPGVFAEPAIALSHLAGTLDWTIGDDGLPAAVETARIAFANADAAGELSGRWRRAAAGPGAVDLTGRLTRASAVRTARYLPQSLPQAVRDWVAQAVTAGHADRVDFRLRGDLREFPYRDPRAGEFRVAARLRDGALRYAPDWPVIDGVRAELVFERAGMRLAAGAARTLDVPLGEVHVAIDDFASPVLRVDGTARGPAQQMLRFVDASPVADRIDRFTADATATGAAALELALRLPLRDPKLAGVQGTVHLAGNAVTLDRALPRFEAVSGRIEFTESAFALRDLQAAFLGGSVRVSGETVEPGRLRVRAEGTASAAGLRGQVDNAITRRLSGSLRYRATIDARRQAPSVRIDSDLVGLAADLPAPFGKAAEAALPLRVDAVPAAPSDARGRPAGDVVSAQLGEAIRVAFERRRVGDHMRVRRGAFAVGTEPVLPEAGFAVLVSQPRLDLDAWHALLGQVDPAAPAANAPAAPAVAPSASSAAPATATSDASSTATAAAPAASTAPAARATSAAPAAASIAPVAASTAPTSNTLADDFTLLPSTVSVVAQELRVAGKDLHAVVLGASRAGGFWRANISSREVEGFFNWREAGAGQSVGTLTARFARLAIPPSRAAEVESLLDSPPERLPGLDIAAEEFVLGDKSLGRLSLLATSGGSAANPSWRLERLVLESSAARLDATGRWERRPGTRERATELKFELALADAGALLARLGVRDAIRGGAGLLAGEVGWQGSPLSIHYPTLAGSVRLQLGEGQFLKVDPGLAKLIGVLNLQSLPRRLTLDFRDVFSEGFAFDRIDADVRIERGVARTDNFRMRGVQATVGIRGEADLARETQDLRVRVLPELNAGLASLAYAALANPLIGLGSFVAQWVMRGPLQQAFAYDVDVQGSWADPVVRPVARADRLEPAVP